MSLIELNSPQQNKYLDPRLRSGQVAVHPMVAEKIVIDGFIPLDNQKILNKWELSKYNLIDFAELFFPSPEDPTAPLLLSKGQKRIFRFMQAGDTKTAILLASRGSGKSVGCSAAAAALICSRPCSVGLFGANLDKAIKLNRMIRHFINNSVFNRWIDKKIDSKREFHMKFPDSWCCGNPLSETARGDHYDYGLVDEMSLIDDKTFYGVIYSTFRRRGIHWIGLSTPAGAAGPFYKYWNNSGPGKRHTRLYITIKDQDWLQRVVDWENKQRGTQMTIQEYLELERLDMGDAMFRQEVLCEFLQLGSGVFPDELINQAMMIHDKRRMYPASHNNFKKGRYYVIGIDFGKYHSNTCFCIGHRDKRGNIWLDDIKTFGKRTDYLPIVKELGNWVKRWNIKLIVPDATGLGDPAVEMIGEMLRRRKLPARVFSNKKNRPGFVFDSRSKPDLIDNLVKLLEENKLRLPYHYNAVIASDAGWEMKNLREEMLAFTYEVTDKGVKYQASGTPADRVMALALLCWGMKRKPFKYINIKKR